MSNRYTVYKQSKWCKLSKVIRKEVACVFLLVYEDAPATATHITRKYSMLIMCYFRGLTPIILSSMSTIGALSDPCWSHA